MATTLERFWTKVDKGPDCWDWNAGLRNGYGVFGVKAGHVEYAHRISAMIHYGAFDRRAIIMHTCDNRKCVNPDHLRVATQAENLADMAAKERSTKGRPRPWQETAKIACPQCGDMFKPHRLHGRPPTRWCSIACSNRGRVQ